MKRARKNPRPDRSRVAVGSAPADKPAPTKRRVAWAAALALVAFAVFSNTIDASFVWDDEQFIQRNVYLTSWTHVPALVTQNMVAGAGITSNLYRPLQALTHFLDVRLWGLRPHGHHFTNVMLHALATGAFFWWLSGL